VSLPIPIRNPLLCYVTDGQTGPHPSRESLQALLQKIEIVASAGVDWIQIREKDLSGRQLAELARKAIQRVPQECLILLNDRVDVALAVAAGGLHLGEKSISLADARRLIDGHGGLGTFLVGASTHSLEAALANEKQGADYLIFGPVFETPSKAGYGPAQGLQQLEKVCRSISVPVLAIGGITQENAQQCLDHGAAGIAAIRMFQDVDLRDWIGNLRRN
jgi:thiamine-phosphate pyrophosphorylase